jgi:hypothetical protein
MTKDWTTADLGELAAELKLLRPPAEVAAALGREESEVIDKMLELGLPAPSIVPHDAPSSPPPRRRRARR